MNTMSEPTPLDIAQRWGFPLQYHEIDGTCFYSVHDWLNGIGVSNARRYWRDIQSRTRIPLQPVKRPYSASNGKQYQMHFMNAPDLLRVTRNEPARRHVTWEILLGDIPQPVASQYVYVIGLRDAPGVYKIGIASNPARRLESIRCHNPFSPYFHLCIETPDAERFEQELHAAFSAERVTHEWFKLSPQHLAELEDMLTV